ncbi:hypothetical protein Syun_009782 [Stephania yunnanensis]|uniref:Uncharacterized protein n=1 Tax=Stephania yunnanensis TaxID=152371 RepID=A0AAP0KGT5_9MAGN
MEELVYIGNDNTSYMTTQYVDVHAWSSTLHNNNIMFFQKNSPVFFRTHPRVFLYIEYFS